MSEQLDFLSDRDESLLNDHFGLDHAVHYASPILKKNGISHSGATSPRKRNSRDEMNLAEFPLSVLSTRVSPGKKTLEFSDSIIDRNGNAIDRQWIITAADKFGLPTSSDDEVLLGLLKISVDKGLDRRKVYFTRYELLKVLRWSTEGRSYTRLTNALDRLSGVRIKASNSFFDNTLKSYSTRNFGLIDAYEINSGRSQNPKPSYFIWSEELFNSFNSGFIKKLDFEFFLDLESSVTKRLYRFLDKHFWYRSRFRMNLFTLAHEKIGISRTYKFPSSIRQQIDPAAEELIAKGFLSEVLYEGRGKHTEVTFVASRENGNRSQQKLPRENKNDWKSVASVTRAASVGDAAAVRDIIVDPVKVQSKFVDVGLSPKDLMRRGVNEPQAVSLVERIVQNGMVERAQQIVAYFDQLVAEGSSLVSRNAPGFLYKALRNPRDFSLPGEGGIRELRETTKPSSGQSIKSSAGQSFTKSFGTNSQSGNESNRLAKRKADHQTLELEYLTERKRDLARMKQELEPHLLHGLNGEVEEALRNIRSLVSQAGFEEAVSHGVEERIAKLFAYPSFEEWKRSRIRGR